MFDVSDVRFLAARRISGTGIARGAAVPAPLNDGTVTAWQLL
jgi:hypothetical protein